MVKAVCPVTQIMTYLNQKWVLHILREIGSGKPKRFTELERNITGINSRILCKRLSEMEEMRLITKKQYREMPPRVEYSLTSKGIGLLDCFAYLNKWAKRWN